MDKYAIVEKANHHALHGLFDSLDRAENHLRNIIPRYVARGYFIDKTLTAESFEIIDRGKQS